MSEIAEHVPGYDKDFVVSFQDVLSGKVTVSGSAVVIGGGRTGIETARYLAARGVLVTILERLPEIATDLDASCRLRLGEDMRKEGILPVTGVTVTEIRGGIDNRAAAGAFDADKEFFAYGSSGKRGRKAYREVIGEKDGITIGFPCNYAVMAGGS